MIVFRKMMLDSIAPQLDPQAVKGLRAQTPLFALRHVLQQGVHLLGILASLLASQKLGVGHAVLSPNHKNLGIRTLTLHQHNPARNDGVLATSEYVSL